MPKTRVRRCKAVCKTFHRWIALPRTRCANTSSHSVNVWGKLILFWAELSVRSAGDPGIAPGNDGNDEIWLAYLNQTLKGIWFGVPCNAGFRISRDIGSALERACLVPQPARFHVSQHFCEMVARVAS